MNKPVPLSAEQKARILIASVTAALAAGHKHYGADGRELKTVFEVVQELANMHEVRVETAP